MEKVRNLGVIIHTHNSGMVETDLGNKLPTRTAEAGNIMLESVATGKRFCVPKKEFSKYKNHVVEEEAKETVRADALRVIEEQASEIVDLKKRIESLEEENNALGADNIMLVNKNQELSQVVDAQSEEIKKLEEASAQGKAAAKTPPTKKSTEVKDGK